MAGVLLSRRSRRIFSLLAVATVVIIIYHSIATPESRRAPPLETVDIGEKEVQLDNTRDAEIRLTGQSDEGYSGNGASNDRFFPINGFSPGEVKGVGTAYTKMLVIPRTKREDVSWIAQSFRNTSIETTIYVADDPSAPFHPPENKGHEAMVYLTYIIDHYENLADINIFMHSHRYAWHNDDLHDNDAVKVITRLSPDRVQREGYMNLRCSWHPGCPDWLHPGAVEEDNNKKEEVEFANAWSELFPGVPVPPVVAQPCCAQFAVSKSRIQALTKTKYVQLRDWLLRTPLIDSISGRVWEYVWHYIFTGQATYCPKEHVCYCDGYGICFGGEEQYNAWWEKMWEKRHYEYQLKDWHLRVDEITKTMDEGRIDEEKALKAPEFGQDEELKGKIAALEAELNAEKLQAIRLGNNPMNRAKEAGRYWKEGDGF